MNDKSALLLPNVDLNNDTIPASTQSLFDHAITQLIINPASFFYDSSKSFPDAKHSESLMEDSYSEGPPSSPSLCRAQKTLPRVQDSPTEDSELKEEESVVPI